MRLSRDSVRAWRLGRQLLEPLIDADAVSVVRRLCGVQAQLLSAGGARGSGAATAAPARTGRAGLAEGRLIRTRAARGTLQVLDPIDAPAYLALLAAARIREKPARSGRS